MSEIELHFIVETDKEAGPLGQAVYELLERNGTVKESSAGDLTRRFAVKGVEEGRATVRVIEAADEHAARAAAKDEGLIPVEVDPVFYPGGPADPWVECGPVTLVWNVEGGEDG